MSHNLKALGLAGMLTLAASQLPAQENSRIQDALPLGIVSGEFVPYPPLDKKYLKMTTRKLFHRRSEIQRAMARYEIPIDIVFDAETLRACEDKGGCFDLLTEVDPWDSSAMQAYCDARGEDDAASVVVQFSNPPRVFALCNREASRIYDSLDSELTDVNRALRDRGIYR